MKKTILVIVALALVVALCGCEGVKLTLTGVGTKTTIEAKDAEDGSYIENSPFYVGKGKVLLVESSLDKGQLKIDFVEATVFKRDSGLDDVILGDVAESITVGAGDSIEVSLPKGDYVMQITTVGTTNGKVVIDFEK